MNQKLFIPLVLFLVFTCIRAGAEVPTQGVSASEVVIGAHISASGRSAFSIDYSKALAAYFEDINQTGGVAGRKIKWLPIDTASLHTKTAEATHSLVERDQIFAMVGGQGPSHIAIWKYLLDKNIPDVLVHDWMSEYVKPLRHTLFMAWYTHDSDGEFHGRYVVRHFKGKKVCWLTADMASTEQWQIASERAIKEENEKVKKEDQITIGINAKIDRLAAQANSEILKFQKEGCDIVMLNTQGNSVGASAINFAANQGYFPKWTMGWANITSSFSKLVNKKSQEGVIATSPFALDDGMGAKDFSKFRDFAQKHNIEVAGNGARGFYVAEVFVEALRRTGKELTAEKFLATLEQMTGYVCSLCVTPLEWSPTNHQAITKEIVLTVHDGKWVRASD